MKIAVVVIFLLMYCLMIVFTRFRAVTALGVAVLFVAMGVLPLSQIAGAINWNVLLMLAGTMGTVTLFIESRMPNRIADFLVNKAGNVLWVTVIMSLFAGIVSAFIDNVATVLMIAPVGLAIASKCKISPVSMLICISVSSNLQGAATLVGDATSILLGGYANMDFLDFFWMQGKPGIFFAVELGALVTVAVLYFMFRKNRDKIPVTDVTPVTDYVPTILLTANILLLIAASFVPNKPEITNGLICMAVSIVGYIASAIRARSFKHAKNAIANIDYQTLLLLASLFVVIGGITQAGIIDDLSRMLTSLGGGSLFLMYTVIVWGSVLCSAFVDNIPYVATMLPVVQGISGIMGCEPYLLYFGLLCGATLGGNLTPVGASANIATTGILEKGGYTVKAADFMKIGVPFTLAAVMAGYLFIWFVWA